MDIDERMRIERACERLVTTYCHFIDHGEAGRVAELFTEDGVWRSPEITMDGIESLRKGFAHRQNRTDRMSRHVCNNLIVDVVATDHATGCVYRTLYNHDGEPERPFSPLDGARLVGEYRDEFRRTSEGWRFSRRDVHVSFVRPAPAESP